MTDLPTCWYCPECGQVGGGHKLECYSKTPPSPIKVPMILPGTPLTVILDTLGIEYHVEGRQMPYVAGQPITSRVVLVVPIPATDEAHDG